MTAIAPRPESFLILEPSVSSDAARFVRAISEYAENCFR